jgi:quercetin dioxygenase-like cupin family protein
MNRNYLKNIDFASPQVFADLVSYQPGQVVSKTLAQNPAVSLTLFAFAKGEEISSHESKGDAMVVVLDGEGQITIGSEQFIVKAGESIVMPANTPHAVYAKEAFKMFLVVVFPHE